ncbi:hypothetical protein GCM10023147_00760 [Tsukamurella soli]|uniref:Uncharacterized protein n=1 Tax=Tsukamurella soli TaxID=644556 RepID=A0ABP8J0F7_9ACTN
MERKPQPLLGFADAIAAARAGPGGEACRARDLRRAGSRDRKGAPDTFDADGYAALVRRLTEPGRSRVTYAPPWSGPSSSPSPGRSPSIRVAGW